MFKQLASAIAYHHVNDFLFHEQNYSHVEPYKLVSNRGVWYLAMRHHGKLRYLRVSEIRSVKLTPERYLFDAKILEEIQANRFC